jgi:hypothetical protein
MVKKHSFKLELPLWSHLTAAGIFNLNMMLKIEFKNIKALMDL